MNNSISLVAFLPADIAAGHAGAPPPESRARRFSHSLKQSMDAVAGAQGEAENQVAQLLNGQGADLHSAMIAVEKADLSFQLMMQVRNKIVQAYQQVSNMQF